MTIAVPISWPTTMIPTVAWRPMSLTLDDRLLEALGVDLDHELALVELVEPAERGALERGHLAGQLLADPDRAALDLLLELLRRERIEQRGPRLGHGRLAEVDVERQRAGRLLGLDDRLDRQRQLAVELQAVVEDRAEEGARARRPSDVALP